MQQVAVEKLSALHFFYRASNDCNTCNSSDQRMLALHLFSEIVDLFFLSRNRVMMLKNHLGQFLQWMCTC